MRIEIADSNRFGRLDPARLAAFEKASGTVLPEQYRARLLQHNGGYVHGARKIHELHHVYGIHDGPEWGRLLPPGVRLPGLLPNKLLPIADDPGGNLYCISLSGADRGAVYFWNHERAVDPSRSTTLLAPDFDAFQRGLALKVAIARDQVDDVWSAVQEVGLDAVVYEGKTALELALERGSEAVIRKLLDAGARVPRDALVSVARSASVLIAEALLARGVDVNHAVVETGFTALMMASSADAVDVAALLLRHGADPAKRNRWGKTAAELAHSARMKDLLRR
jgi:hypothetical protein